MAHSPIATRCLRMPSQAMSGDMQALSPDLMPDVVPEIQYKSSTKDVWLWTVDLCPESGQGQRMGEVLVSYEDLYEMGREMGFGDGREELHRFGNH